MCTDGSNADNSTLEPKRQDYNTLVEDVKLLNETSERGKADYESDIVYTISLGYRAYENNDQTLLTKAVEDLNTIKSMLGPDPKEQPPPKWMLCRCLAKRVLQCIDRFETTPDIKPHIKKMYTPSIEPDRRALQNVLDALQDEPDDETCEPLAKIVHTISPKWEEPVIFEDPFSSKKYRV